MRRAMYQRMDTHSSMKKPRRRSWVDITMPWNIQLNAVEIKSSLVLRCYDYSDDDDDDDECRQWKDIMSSINEH